MRYAVRHPATSITACAMGGTTIAPRALPAIMTASACPRRSSNQLAMTREYTTGELPADARPTTANIEYRCQSPGVRSASDAKAPPVTIRQGPQIQRVPERSRSSPISGAEIAEASVMTAYADEIASLDHENSAASGLRNTGNVKKTIVTKNTPVAEAATTGHPW
jgi:hypothetical protein